MWVRLSHTVGNGIPRELGSLSLSLSSHDWEVGFLTKRGGGGEKDGKTSLYRPWLTFIGSSIKRNKGGGGGGETPTNKILPTTLPLLYYYISPQFSSSSSSSPIDKISSNFAPACLSLSLFFSLYQWENWLFSLGRMTVRPMGTEWGSWWRRRRTAELGNIFLFKSFWFFSHSGRRETQQKKNRDETFPEGIKNDFLVPSFFFSSFLSLSPRYGEKQPTLISCHPDTTWLLQGGRLLFLDAVY